MGEQGLSVPPLPEQVQVDVELSGGRFITNKKEDLICIDGRSAMKHIDLGYHGCQKIIWVE